MRDKFGPEGALVAFLMFNAVKGVDMLGHAYISYHDNRPTRPGIDGRTEGKGYTLNWFFQMVVITLAGGYVCRSPIRSLLGLSMLDYLLLFIIATILLWDKIFPNRPLLSRLCTSLMEGASTRYSIQEGTTVHQHTGDVKN